LQRGMPYSLFIHAVVLALVLAYGSFVAPTPVEPRRLFHVRLATLPRPASPTSPAAEPVPEPVVTEPAPTPPPPKEPEPQKVPEKPQDKPVAKPVETKPEPEPVRPRDEVPPADDVGAQPAGETGEPALTTDEHFPFAWYLNLVKGRVSMQWQPKQLGFRESTRRSCVVHFVIDRRGAISRAAVLQSSGVALFDREAVRAVQAAHPLPALPREYSGSTLGISVSFILKSGP
jgi:TonB family protein